MTVEGVSVDPLPLSVRTLRASADVIEVAEPHGFCASVLVLPGHTAVARLDRSLQGAPHEGRVLREVMLTTTGAFGQDLYLWYLIAGQLVCWRLGA